jgi:hypothetical protein
LCDFFQRVSYEVPDRKETLLFRQDQNRNLKING